MVKAKVLFIDDEPVILEFAKEIFEASGYEIEILDSSISALETLRFKKFDIIITDFNMPILTGFELVSKIRDELKVETPVILFTGNLQLNNIKAEHLKIIKVFNKPMDFEGVISFVSQYLNRN